MDILSIMNLLWRQRIVVGVMTVVSVILLVTVVLQSPPLYQATSSVVLFNPPRPPDTVKVVPGTEEAKKLENPFVRFNDTSVVVDILRRVLVSDATAERLREKGVTGTYTVAANLDFYRGPIIDVSAEATSPEQAITSTAAVVEELEATLVQMQESQGTDPLYYFTADVVVAPSKAKRIITGTLRRVIAGGAVSAFMVLGSAVAADTISARRRKAAGGGKRSANGAPSLIPEGAAAYVAAEDGGRLSLVTPSQTGVR